MCVFVVGGWSLCAIHWVTGWLLGERESRSPLRLLAVGFVTDAMQREVRETREATYLLRLSPLVVLTAADIEFSEEVSAR